MTGSPPQHTGGETISSSFGRQAAADPSRPFVVFEDVDGGVTTFTYGETAARAARVAGALERLGVERGSTVHLHLPNCPEFYDVWLGAAQIGAAIVPTNPLSTVDELSYMVEHARCRVSITQPNLADAVRRAAPDRRPVLVARSTTDVPGCRLLEEAIEAAAPVSGASAAGPRDLAAVLYTSGTTSRPKGVMITHASYVHAGEAVAQHLRMRPDDRTLIVLPLFHGNAQYYSTMPALVTGASIALVERFSASRWSRQAHQLDATVASLFAAPIRMILGQPPSESDRAHRLRATMFAQNVTDEQVAEFERRFAVPLVQLYGMTETVAPATLNPLYGERRNHTIGRPMLWARVRIVDESGEDVPVGEAGELLVGGVPGETILAGYLHAPEATEEALEDGWLHTGDNVRADADGYLHFVDRSKDMIKRAGENVAAGEVERVLNDHPAVYESACVGVPDTIRDEAILAFIVLREGASVDADQLSAWCAGRLASFKVPSKFAFIDELPRTSVGKVQKHLLKDRAATRR